MISYNSEKVKVPQIRRRDTSAWIKNVAALHGKKVGDIAYIFCDDEKILEVNRQYLQHDYYTDIITFDYSEDDVISGDIFISLDTVRTNAEQFATQSERFKSPYEQELHRVIIHGVLHLCGINDKGPGEREIMEQNENEALALL
ncbi:MAG: rRNA maturation RNase YbeY [Bacteroidaceae bacterium]|nr:rRNA maturation RNase YbeY [Bacteroidaceae bacterium]